MDPILQKVLILGAAMPSAATTVMYAVQYDTEATFLKHNADYDITKCIHHYSTTNYIRIK